MRAFAAAILLGCATLTPNMAAAQTAQVAPIRYTSRTLANGLRVYAIRDTGTANVSVQVWYDVGSKDDPKDRSGFAHLFEHLLFKATRNLAPEQFDRLTEDVGGYNNASTDDDFTEYHEVVPANHLQRLLFAEADRMASLVIDQASFASERAVVEEELRQNTLARPYGKLYGLYYPLASYRVHPYARPGIGSLANLDAATVDDVRAFHATYYRPDNAVLVVAGNFDPDQLDRWVDAYFGPIAKPDRPIPRVTAVEPPRTAAAHYTVYEPDTPLPAVLLSWHIPADRDPDNAPLQVLDAILATGESSRLYQALVYRDRLAQSVSTELDSKQATGNFAAVAIAAGGKHVAATEAALRREIARLRDAPATAAELAEAKNELLTQALRERETAEGKASLIASGVIVDGDAEAANRDPAAIAAVTLADVQRVARTYLGDAQSVAIRYLPPAPGRTSDPIRLADTVAVAPLAVPAGVALVSVATAAERIAPPPAGPLIAADLPRPATATLADGLTVIAVPKPGQPIVTALLVANGGARRDRPGAAGIASVTAELMTKGTRTRTATQLAAATEALGTELTANATRDGMILGMTVKSDELAPVLGLLAEVAETPRFAPAELARARAQAIDNAQLTLADPGDLASLVAARAVFGDAGYGAPLEGTPTSLSRVTAADPPAAWARTWYPANATLILAGDITAAQAQQLAEGAFGGWRRTGTTQSVEPPAIPAAPLPPRVIVVDMPDAAQAGVVVARPTLTRRDPDYYAALAANALLGGGYSARLNQEIRIRRGLSYNAGSTLAARKAGGLLSATTQTKNGSVAEVVALVTAELARLGTAPAAPAELDPRKAALTGGFGREIETSDGIASTLASYVLNRVPLTTLDSYVGTVASVSPVAAQAAANRYFDPARASIVVVGDARQFADALRKVYPNLEIIPAARLNLDRAALR